MKKGRRFLNLKILECNEVALGVDSGESGAGERSGKVASHCLVKG